MISAKIFILCLFLNNNLNTCESTNYLNKLGVQAYSNNGFGKYFANTERIEKCQTTLRPIDKDHYTSMNIGVRKLNRTREIFTGYAYLPNDLQYYESLIAINYWKDGGFRPLYSKTIKNPCSDVLLSTLLSFLHPDINCCVKQGNYTFMLKRDLNELAHLLAGDNFFYARLAFRVEIYSKKGTVYCLKVNCQTKAIQKTKPSA